MVKEKTIPSYQFNFYGSNVELKDVVVYLEEDSEEQDFTPDIPHKIPRFEMARVALVSAAMQNEPINLEKDDITNGVLDMYIKACLKELSLAPENTRKQRVEKILEALERFRQS